MTTTLTETQIKTLEASAKGSLVPTNRTSLDRGWAHRRTLETLARLGLVECNGAYYRATSAGRAELAREGRG